MSSVAAPVFVFVCICVCVCVCVCVCARARASAGASRVFCLSLHLSLYCACVYHGASSASVGASCTAGAFRPASSADSPPLSTRRAPPATLSGPSSTFTRHIICEYANTHTHTQRKQTQTNTCIPPSIHLSIDTLATDTLTFAIPVTSRVQGPKWSVPARVEALVPGLPLVHLLAIAGDVARPAALPGACPLGRLPGSLSARRPLLLSSAQCLQENVAS